jgi:hypothetical protein
VATGSGKSSSFRGLTSLDDIQGRVAAGQEKEEGAPNPQELHMAAKDDVDGML